MAVLVKAYLTAAKPNLAQHNIPDEILPSSQIAVITQDLYFVRATGFNRFQSGFPLSEMIYRNHRRIMDIPASNDLQLTAWRRASPNRNVGILLQHHIISEWRT